MDGLRLDWPGRWLLVRPSNTEPIVRAIAEAGREGEARALCQAAAEAIGR
jgi:phosphomannomutase